MYMVFEFDYASTFEVFNSPMQAMFDMFLISVDNLDGYYSKIQNTKYNIIGQVSILEWWESIESGKTTTNGGPIDDISHRFAPSNCLQTLL